MSVLIILLFLSCTNAASAQLKRCKDTVKNDIIFSDTTITLKNGTTVTFNRCDFFDIKDCLEMYEIRTLKDISDANITTEDNQGNPLQSGGMFVLEFNKGDDCETNKECLDNPIKIRIPILPSICNVNPLPNNLYRMGKSGKWELVNNPAKEVVNDKGERFLEFFTNCSGRFNCDKRCLVTTVVKFKSHVLKQITKFTVSSNCPLLKLSYSAAKRQNIVFAKIPCLNPDSLIIHIEGINRNGETISITKSLSQLQSKFFQSKCGTITNKVVRRVLGIFPLKERNVY